MPDWPDISVVIVTWNSARWIEPCLDALARTEAPTPPETVVVDNASGDNGADRAARHAIGAHVIRNARNEGFGGANNIGWRAASGEIVVFLNPDTEVRPGWLAPLVERFVADPDVAILGAKLLYPDGRTIQHAGGMIHVNAMGDHIGAGEPDHGQRDATRDVDYVTGAAMAVRRGFLEATGGFDPVFYPAYYEETDLCVEAWARGLRVAVEPRSVIVHHESACVERASPTFLRLFMTGRARLMTKRFTSLDWLRFCLFELRWLRSPHARGVRRRVVRSYARVLGAECAPSKKTPKD